MAEGFYLDNDVILKTCAYGVALELLKATTVDSTPPSILAVSRYTMLGRVKRSKSLIDKMGAEVALKAFLDRVVALEPTPDEIDLAADLESQATAQNLAFDTGESQIVAMMIVRGAVAFVSGDKRAARAMCVVLPNLLNKVICLEQVLHTLLSVVDISAFRKAVCREVASDRAVAACFQCSRQEVDAAEIYAALFSYSESLRKETKGLLISTPDMSGAEVP